MAPNDNLTAVLYGIEDLRLENQDIPAIKDDGKSSYLNSNLVFNKYFNRGAHRDGLCWNLRFGRSLSGARKDWRFYCEG